MLKQKTKYLKIGVVHEKVFKTNYYLNLNDNEVYYKKTSSFIAMREMRFINFLMICAGLPFFNLIYMTTQEDNYSIFLKVFIYLFLFAYWIILEIIFSRIMLIVDLKRNKLIEAFDGTLNYVFTSIVFPKYGKRLNLIFYCIIMIVASFIIYFVINSLLFSYIAIFWTARMCRYTYIQYNCVFKLYEDYINDNL